MMNKLQRLSFETARKQASMEAARRHARLHTDRSQRIDIFDIVQQDGLWLMLQPLRKLYGCYLNVDGVEGILVNSNHPLSLQRYTAAHEYGHFVLKHGVSLDEANTILPDINESRLQEAAAQTFAAHFLMPLQLVNTVLLKMGLPSKPGRLKPEEAYRFSLEVGTSYTAAINHLATLEKITWRVAKELRAEEPKTIKAEIGHGTRPQDSWADVLDFDEYDSGRQVHLQVNDEVHIKLPETPSTGYIWMVDNLAIPDLRKEVPEQQFEGESCLVLVDERFESNSRSGELRLGSGGSHRFVFRSLKSGSQTLRIINKRPWQNKAAPLKVFEISFDVSSRGIQGLSDLQHESLLVGV
jgi:Zn-dependent peptidase ImmA (M78 family)/predicted secreted protein